MTAPRVVVLPESQDGHSFRIAIPADEQNLAPIVCVHGMGCSSRLFVRMMTHLALSTGRRVYAIDINRHLDEKKVLIDHYVADVAHFLRKVVDPEHRRLPILVGHSMGGLITLGLSALGYAERAVLITPAPPKGITHHLGKFIIPTVEDVQGFMNMCFTGRSFHASTHMLGQIFADPKTDKKLIEELAEIFEFQEAYSVIQELRTSSYQVDSRAVKVPLLVIGAGKDVLVSTAVFRGVAKQYRADYVEFTHLGHFCIFETGWEDVAEYIERWIKQRKTWKPKK